MSFSAGAVAGVGLGCAVVAVLITLAIQWFFRRIEKVKRHLNPGFYDFNHDFKMCNQLANWLNQWVLPREDPNIIKEYRGLYNAVEHFIHKWCLTHEPVVYDSSALTALAGHHEDWDRYSEVEWHRRSSVLCHFVARVLLPRMTPDGDLNTTLLPQDMLSTYQRMMTKPVEHLSGTASRHFPGNRLSGMVRHFCRALIVHFSSDKMPTKFEYWWYNYPEDDPRMKNMIATEDLLRTALVPFENNGRYKNDDLTPGGLNGEQARKEMRKIVTAAADFALTAFAQARPVEFFWPASGRPETKEKNNDKLVLEWFGMRQANRVPGSERDHLGEKTEFVVVQEVRDDESGQREDDKDYLRMLLMGRVPGRTPPVREPVTGYPPFTGPDVKEVHPRRASVEDARARRASVAGARA